MMSRKPSSPAALAVAAGIMLSRVSGLIRDRVFAYYLGNSEAAGAFKAALRIPNLLQNLFGEGVLSASFIPVYARLRAEGRDADAVRLAAAIGSGLAALVALLAAVGVLGAEALIELLAPGFSGDVRILTTQIVRVMFPGVALLVLSAWCLGILNSHKKFFLSYAAPVVWNAAIVATLLYFGATRTSDSAGQFELVRYMAWGTVAGSALQLIIQLPSVWHLCSGLRPIWPGHDPQVLTVWRNFLPIVLTRGVVQISAYIDQMIASYLGASMVAAMAYAQTLYLLPISLFGMSISAAELPAMSAVTGDTTAIKEQLREKLVRSLRRVAYFVIPSMVAFAALGDVVIATVFQTGEFKQNNVMDVWMILAGATIGLLATTQGRLFSTAFYAMRQTRIPMRLALVRVALTIIGGYLLALPLRRSLGLGEVWGAAFLTASAGFAGWVEYLLLRRALMRELGVWHVGFRYLACLWLIASLAAVLAFGGRQLLVHYLWSDLSPVIMGVLVLGVYGGVYVGATILMRLGEGDTLRRRLFKS